MFCDIGYTIYYKVYFRAEEDGTEYACVVRAKDGEVMSLTHAEPEGAASQDLVWKSDKRGTPGTEQGAEAEEQVSLDR